MLLVKIYELCKHENAGGKFELIICLKDVFLD